MRTHLVEASRGERWLARGLRAVLICALVAGALSVWNEARAQSAERALDANSFALAAPGGLLPGAPPTSVAIGALAAQRAVDRGDR